MPHDLIPTRLRSKRLELGDVLRDCATLAKTDESIVDIIGVKVVTIEVVEKVGKELPVRQVAFGVLSEADDVRVTNRDPDLSRLCHEPVTNLSRTDANSVKIQDAHPTLM